ncbi:MAG: ABC transporter permease [Candidatus Thorarchaeota archaeon]|nr:MAG: ABC transporter permease [Candidatus Thorarchaeota archaeon]
MAAVPVGYEAFHSLRRKVVTLVCFLLASGMAMGIAVYVDSTSVHEWNRLTDIGPIAMTIDVDGYRPTDVASVLEIPSVEKAATIEARWIDLYPIDAVPDDYYYYYYGGGRAVAFDSEYLEAFPSVYQIVEGRFPENHSEIALELEIAESYDHSVGELLNVSTMAYIDYDWQPYYQVMEIVGLFRTPTSGLIQDPWDWYYYSDFGIGIFWPGAFPDDGDERTSIHVDVDRSAITPFDARGSLTFILSIEELIRELDPGYSPQTPWSRFQVNGLLSRGIVEFTEWQSATRFGQLTRAAGIILLAGLVMFLAIRHNVNERRYEANMLVSRGASKGAVDGIVNREIGILSLPGLLIGLGVGILLSRIAIASTGFMEFDMARLIGEPFLITLDSLVLAIVIGVAVPIGSLLSYRIVYSTRKPVEEQTGKLAKIAKGLHLIRWDVLVLVLTSFLVFALFSSGSAIQLNPLLSLLLDVAPLALFLAVASLSIKGLRRGAGLISRGMKRVVGHVPSIIGIRRIGKGASSAGAVAIVMVLAMSTAWSFSVLGSSLPPTKISHARFAFGGDVVFHLDDTQNSSWNTFLDNVTSDIDTQAAALVSVSQMYLSASGGDNVDAVAMNPLEYRNVGYDYLGSMLNDSALGNSLEELNSNPEGAIITQDIADSYGLVAGDSFRAFIDTGLEQIVFTFTVISVHVGLSNCLFLESGNDAPTWWWSFVQVGARVIWVNKNFLSAQIDLIEAADSVVCVRTRHGANGTNIAMRVLDQGGTQVVRVEQWNTVTKELAEYMTIASYRMDRAVDNMLLFTMVGVVFGAFTVYAAEGLREKRREIALMRSMGAGTPLVVRSQIAEMLVLLIVSVLLLFGYGPLSFSITLLTYPTSYYYYPVSVFPVIPWVSMFSILFLFILSILAYTVVVSIMGSRVILHDALNAAWAEAGPYGGDL